MPGEIDTGGPRVLLHCVERPDCPIPRSSSIVTFSSSHVHRSFATIRHRTCPVVVAASHLDYSTLHESSAESRTIPGNDERNEFFRYERSPPVSSTSSNDLGIAASPRDRRGRKRSGEILERHRARRRNSINDEMAQRMRVVDGKNNENVPKIDEFNRKNIVEGCAIDETRERTSTIREEEKLSFAGTTACNLTRLTGEEEEEHRERLVRESSAIVMRLFDGCGVEQEYQSMCPTNVKSSAANSSQRSRNREVSDDFVAANPLRNDEDTGDYRLDYEWKCDDMREFKNCENLTSDRRKRPKNNRQKCRTYLQLALLIFLVAFGHNSLFKTRHAGFGGNSGIGAGLGVITIGTIVRTVGALPIDIDAGVRAERSANLSHITGASRKIQMYIKNRHLQILPDGTVNGSNDDTSEYTIFQRASVSRGQLRIQGVATCLYLCMDSCGLLYGSREYTEDCVFNETLEQHNYNTYSSVRWSTAKKTLYLGLNRRGQPRRVQAKGHNLGRLSAYARVLTQVAPPDRVEALQSRLLGAQHNLRHHHNSHHHRNMQQMVCPNLPPQEKDGRDKFRCRKRKKRKKRKRPCNDGEKPGPHCEIDEDQASHRANAETSGEGPPQSKRSCEGAASEELCRKQALDAPAKKRKSRIETAKKIAGQRDNQQQEKQQKSSSRKDLKTRKNIGGKKSNFGGINAEEDSNKRGNGTNVKRKRPASRQRTALAKRRNNGGRATRTTLPTNSAIAAMTLPSTWFPGASTTSPSIDRSPRRRTKTSISPRNSVTSDTLKTNVSQSSRNGKALERSELATETSSLEWSTENPEDHSALGQTFVEDLSAETSEEAKSDESTQEDDPATSSSLEYSTLMTTMDTTPPERTEDYTRATTTESIHGSIEVSRGRTGIHNEDSTLAEHPRKFSRELRLERLVM